MTLRKLDILLPLAAAVILLMAALVACSSVDMPASEEIPTDPEPIPQAMLSFDLSVPFILDSRTPSGDYDDARSWAYENHIDPNNCQFLIFEPSASGYSNTKLLCVANPEEVLHREDDSKHSAKRYTISGRVPTETLEGGDFKIMVLANWPTRYITEGTPSAGETLLSPGASTIDDIANSSLFEFSETWRLDTDFIPMYGIKECKDVILPDNFMIWLDKIHMLRAMAKIEVTSQYKNQLDRVELVRHSASGYAAPKNVYIEGDYVKADYQKDYTTSAWVPSASVSPSALQMTSFEDANNLKHFYIYVPEYLNVGTPGAESYINLYFVDQPVPARLDFKFYDQEAADNAGVDIGTEFDLLRNYYYKFTVNKSTDLTVIVTLAPYTVVSLNPNFGIDGEDKREPGDYKYE